MGENLPFCLPGPARPGHSCGMHDVARPQGEVFLDARGNGRAMRLTWHHESDLVVLSLWRDGTCASTFRLSKEDVNEFIDALIDGLRDAPGVQVASPGSHRAPVVDRAELPEPHQPAETGHQTFPEFSDGDDDTADEDEQPFTEWAFGGQANAS